MNNAWQLPRVSRAAIFWLSRCFAFLYQQLIDGIVAVSDPSPCYVLTIGSLGLTTAIRRMCISSRLFGFRGWPVTGLTAPLLSLLAVRRMYLMELSGT